MAEKTQISVVLAPAILARLDAYAEKEMRSRSMAASVLIVAALDRYERDQRKAQDDAAR